MATALPASASAACLLQLSRRGLPGTSSVLSPLRTATFRWHGACNVACSCSPGPRPAVPAERRDGVAGHATSPEGTVRIVAVVGEGSISPIKDAPWEEVMRHTVKTLEGELVWRRRRYRVRRASTPGTFYFSVLDNGVISKEYWTIVDVAEDFSWGLFHYHGAAQAAGLSYTGAVLVTPDGSYPDLEDPRLASALENCAIKKWELYTVDNCSCMGAPLGTPEGSKLHHQISPGKESSVLQRR